jgi:hypothetical protein
VLIRAENLLAGATAKCDLQRLGGAIDGGRNHSTLYLAAILDGLSRKSVGWQVGESLEANTRKQHPQANSTTAILSRVNLYNNASAASFMKTLEREEEKPQA